MFSNVWRSAVCKAHIVSAGHRLVRFARSCSCRCSRGHRSWSINPAQGFTRPIAFDQAKPMGPVFSIYSDGLGVVIRTYLGGAAD